MASTNWAGENPLRNAVAKAEREQRREAAVRQARAAAAAGRRGRSL